MTINQPISISHPITESLSNQHTKELSALKQKKFRELTGKVVIEGFRLVDQILSNGILPEALITSDEHFNGTFPFKSEYHGRVWQATASQMERICDTKQPQDWAAIMSCQTRKIVDSNFILYLDNIQDPGNMGTIFRTAAAAGINGVIRSSSCCELFNLKVIRASLGAVFFVPTENADVDYIESFTGTRIAMCIEGSESIFEYKAPGQNVLLILGSEAEGIQPAILKSVDAKVRIPIAESMESLNVSVAAGISLFIIKHGIRS